MPVLNLLVNIKEISIYLCAFVPFIQVALTCGALEERMYRVYETSGKNMQPKLQEFFATLDRVAAIEQELAHFKEALGVLYIDIQKTKR